METEATSTQVGQAAFPRTNPYMVAITCIWIGAFLIAGILALRGVNAADSFDVEAAAVWFTWANLLAIVGICTLMMWLLVKAIRWQAPEN